MALGPRRKYNRLHLNATYKVDLETSIVSKCDELISIRVIPFINKQLQIRCIPRLITIDTIGDAQFGASLLETFFLEIDKEWRL